MAVLRITWKTEAHVSPSTATVTEREGEDEEAAGTESEKPRADKPMLVWIQDPVDEEANEKIARVVLDPDKIRVGCSFFACVKMTAEAAEADPLLAESGRKFPRMVFISPDYRIVKVLEGKITSSKLYGAMKKAAGKAYKGNFDKNVKRVIKLLGELDKIDNERRILAKKEEKDLKPAQVKKIAKEREELDEREKEALEKRSELLNPKLKRA